MEQVDIFKLLLIVLLLSSRQLASLDEDDNEDNFSYTAINDLLIFAMLLGGFGNNDCKNTTF